MQYKRHSNIIELKYGSTGLPFSLPGTAVGLKPRPILPEIEKQTFCRDFGRRLPESLQDHHRIAVVVADKTRKCGYDSYLPWVVDVLLQKRASKEAIVFYIAYGTHSRQRDETSRECYGHVYDAYEFIHHDCTDRRLFSTLGTTRFGTRIRIRADILSADLIITFGAVSHHYFAGYGGGRKLLFPGLGYRDDIYKNHSLFLDRQVKDLARECRPGRLDDNPIALDLMEIDAALPSKINIHGILDENGRVCRLTAGNTNRDFETVCKTLDSIYRSENTRQFDLVVASCGGFPKDINFIQSHKAIHNAAMFVKDQGQLIILAECPEGIGSASFLEYFDGNGFIDAFKILEARFKGNGTTALSLMKKTGRIHIFLKTEMNEALCQMMKTAKIEMEQIQRTIEINANKNADMAYIENAGLLIS